MKWPRGHPLATAATCGCFRPKIDSSDGRKCSPGTELAARTSSPVSGVSRAVTLLPQHQPMGFLLEVQILGLLDRHGHTEDGPAVELAGRLVLPADRITAVVPDAQAVAAERELRRLR